MDFWVFGFLSFWIVCVLHLCFQSVETAQKLDLEKMAFVSVFTVFLRGVRVVGGGDHICIYIYVYIYTYTRTQPKTTTYMYCEAYFRYLILEL